MRITVTINDTYLGAAREVRDRLKNPSGSEDRITAASLEMSRNVIDRMIVDELLAEIDG